MQMTRAELSRAWKTNRQALTRLFRLPGAPTFDDAGKIDSDVAEAWRASVQAEREKTVRWRDELDRLKCSLAEIELAKAEGKLVSGDEVARIAQEDAAAIRTAMLGAANALAPQLVGLTDTERVRAIVDDWARSTLQAWHDSLAGDARKGL